MIARAPSPVLCIGSVLWDMIGRASCPMPEGTDVPGRISRLPGGVAMNVAMALARLGRTPTLLTAIGRDPEGAELIAACAQLGMVTDHVHRPADLPTDRYMAIEGPDGLVAAIADASTLEAAGAQILAPLIDGPLGRAEAPFAGTIVLDGNLPARLFAEIARSRAFAAADLRVAPASPGKADRLAPLLGQPRTTFYVNRAEAERLCGRAFDGAADAARGLLARGAARVLVTAGGRPAADGHPDGVLDCAPPEVVVARVTGAGDAFMAAHIAAESESAAREDALRRALGTAARHVSGDPML